MQNKLNLPLPIAVALARNDYIKEESNLISVTSLLNSVRRNVLERRVTSTVEPDISDMINTFFGTAVHSYIENTLLRGIDKELEVLNVPEHMRKRIQLIKDTSIQVPQDVVPYYVEIRSRKSVGNFIVSGQFDLVFNGVLYDYKTSTVFAYQKGSSKNRYKMQGSIYRWLNPEIIKNDYLHLIYLFKNWAAKDVYQDNYPKQAIIDDAVQMLSYKETEQFVYSKVAQIEAAMNLPEDQLPHCTPEELWQNDSVWKYYRNPNNRTRSTANFDTPHEAHSRFIKEGSVGIVVEVKSKPAACPLCPAFSICTQKNMYFEPIPANQEILPTLEI